jgi:hypothetical protein
MPKKASTNGKNGHVNGQSDILDEDGFYCLKGDLLWKYRAISAEYEKVQAQVLSNNLAIRNEIEKHPELKKLYEDKGALTAASSVALGELTTVQEEIEKKLGLSLRNCGINDKTGRVFVINPDGTEVPRAPDKKGRKGTRRSAGTAPT